MKRLLSSLTIKILLSSGLLLLLSSCAPAPGLAPSGALKSQLNEIKQQQQTQADQLQQLQKELTQLQEQLLTQNILTATKQPGLYIPDQLKQPTVSNMPPAETPLSPAENQEIVAVAASASSYLAAFSNLAAGHWSAAEAGFQDFLRNFPNHQYSPNARYWLANAQFSQGKMNRAITNLQLIIADPTAQAKTPAALVQLAQIYRQEGQPIQADNILEQLRNRYPESPEAQQLYRSNEPLN
ncbi:tol-pal system protein YbgF [Desulfuromusa kysingii]|uniref:Tol-pal system protein YbgF n=1 Tax=Desulfuromusa kysingii TaxID=37625 RepID=A0A1H3WXY0_9BACT|nr:tol-pal system protein YbgF [Desulfuromusa kysingii]SDZ91234.1 tol-pal system protein YbgF [Desulfuromusa kysingii]